MFKMIKKEDNNIFKVAGENNKFLFNYFENGEIDNEGFYNVPSDSILVVASNRKQAWSIINRYFGENNCTMVNYSVAIH
jgi:hypothetical protein